MQRARNLFVALLAMAMLAIFPLTAMAEDGGSDVVVDHTVDQAEPVDEVKPTDRPSDKPSDKPVRDVKETDKVRDRCLLTDNPRRCLHDDRPHDFDIRHLIWRLIKAHEWEKLIRLLHWLGVI